MTVIEMAQSLEAKRPGLINALGYTDEIFDSLKPLVKPMIANIFEYVLANEASISDEALVALTSAYDTIYKTNNAYELYEKLQQLVQHGEVKEAMPLADDGDEEPEEYYEPVNEPEADEEPAPTEAVTAPVAEATAELSAVASEPIPAEADDGEEEEEAAVKKTRSPRAKPEKGRLRQLLESAVKQYETLEKENKRLTDLSERLNDDNAKLKDRIKELESRLSEVESEGVVPNSLLTKLERIAARVGADVGA